MGLKDIENLVRDGSDCGFGGTLACVRTLRDIEKEGAL
jgi:hypothetical protein